MLVNDTQDQQFAGYLFSYFKGEQTAAGEQVYFALTEGSELGNWRELSSPSTSLRPITTLGPLTSPLGTTGIRDPFLVRGPRRPGPGITPGRGDDQFYLIATDLRIYANTDFSAAQESGSRSILIWEAADLCTWSEPRLVEIAPPTAGNAWAPEATYDPVSGEYVVYWASALYDDVREITASYQRMFYATTRDFKVFSQPQLWIDNRRGSGRGFIDSTVIQDSGWYYRFTKDEATMGIRQERSRQLRSRDWELIAEDVGRGLPNPWGGTFTQGEGPIITASLTRRAWYLLIDQPPYHGGQGYLGLETTDLASGQWQPLPATAAPRDARHGSILRLTPAEHRRLAQFL